MLIKFFRRAGKAGFLLIVFSLLAVPGHALAGKDKVNAELGDIVVYEAADRAPWQLFMGTPANWTVRVTGAETQSTGADKLSVNRVDTDQGDAISASWEAGIGQFYWQSEEPVDLRDYHKQGGALSMVARIDRKPEGKVTLKMGCGYPCEGTLNMETLFGQIPEGQWFHASFELECFKDSGAWMDRIISPLAIASDGEFGISVSDVRITANPEPKTLIRCD